ncbi:NEL-type E3 ubiquitin ligase domain-containing protein [Pseudomonas faucium]|uniref:NEL-type E3 ubiquitin ligase domain-containing protein n=1 Tax=Pseudomonas faucium TaxID=2740518 RepID=UPI0039C39C8C
MQDTDTLAVAQTYQDQLIAKRLPSWMAQLDEAEHALLADALRHLLACRETLAAGFAQVRHLDDFCRPLLQQALDRLGSYRVEALQFRRWYTFTSNSVSYLAGRLPVQDSDTYEQPLLEAALYNFSEDECTEQPRQNAVLDTQGGQQGLTARAFARLCRELDLGQRYQQHLDATLLAPSVKAALVALQRYSMLADAVQAKAEGVLSEAELQLVAGLCRDGRPGWLEGDPVQARQLQLFGCPLQRIVVLQAIDTGVLYNGIKRVLVYVPGDPQGPWSARDDLDSYVRRVLGMRLRDPHYRRFFSRFVRRRDAQQVFLAISERLDDVTDWATRDLDERTTLYPLPLFEHLADAWVAQIKDDCAMIAPPVAQLDRQAQAQHDKRLQAEGWTVLGIAGLYVPAVGAVLAAVMAYELLEETYQAIADWHDDARDAALEHLLAVGKSLALIGATAGTVTLARRAWSPVDNLVTAQLEDGSEKLWNGDLQPYRSEGPAADATWDEQGICRQGEHCWVQMQGDWYRVRQAADDQPWQLEPYQGHAPQLRDNGAGAWRLWHEQPAQWDDLHTMFRRLGRPYSDLDDTQIDQVMAIHGLQADHLRAWHVYGRPAEAGVADTVSRVLLASRIHTLGEQLRTGQAVADTALLAQARALGDAAGEEDQALAEVVWAQRHVLLQQRYDEQLPGSEASRLLRRDFTSLHPLAADEVLRAASEDEREALLKSQQVPLLMAQAARAQVVGIRLARVYEALAFDTPQNLDLARVVLHLLARLPGAASGPGWRLFDADAGQPLLATEGGGGVFELIHRHGVFSLRGVGEAGDLFDVLAQAYTPEQRARTGLGEPFAEALRAHLWAQATGMRDSVEGWLGLNRPNRSFLAPQRFDDGRVGYPLSGGRFWTALRGRAPRALQARLRDLYPAFSDEQLGRWLERDDAPARLEALEQQYSELRHLLNQWVRNAFPSFELLARRELRKELIDCWRWLLPDAGSDAGEQLPCILSHVGGRIQHLPSLPESVSFPHVSVIALRAMRLETLPDEFLHAFPNLRNLEITHCRLRRLPLTQALAQQLEVLDLSDNQIVLDEGQALVLAGCSSLVYLNLSANPLGRTLSIYGMPRLNALYLQGARLERFPYGVMDSAELLTLDLSDNYLDELPERFHDSLLWRVGRVSLGGNLFAAAPDTLTTWHWLEESRVPYRLRWLDVAPDGKRDTLAALWTQLEGEQGAADFFTTLAALTSSGNFKSYPLARNFAARLLDMFEAMLADDALKRELLQHAAVTDCQDNATVRFTDLEVRVQVWRARHGELSQQPERALLRLGGRLWRMHVLDQVAAEHALRAGASSESIEFALAYRIALRARLDLPIRQDDMLYAGIPALGVRDVRRAERAVVAAQSSESLAQFLARQPFWKDYLSAHFPSRLKVPQVFHDELERLMALGNREPEIAQLHIRNQQREHQVMLQLTREALGRVRPATLSDG